MPVKCGMPYALLMAVAIVIAFEVFLRVLPREKLIAYASDYGQYQAVRDTIDLKGPAEVALVGSSQVREGVSMPTLNEALEQQLGHKPDVANYALRGGRVDLADVVVRHLLRQPKPPKLIIVGLSTRDVRAYAPDYERLAVFWTFSDWLREYRTGGRPDTSVLPCFLQNRVGEEILIFERGWDRTDQLPTVIRNYVGEGLLTLKHREMIGIQAANPLRKLFGAPDPREPNPILGEATFQHLGGRGERTLLASKIGLPRLIRSAVSSYLPDPKYYDRPPLAMRERLTDLVAQLTASNVPSRSLIIEMPIAGDLEVAIDRSRKVRMVYGFNREVQSRVYQTNVRYIPTGEQPFKPGKEHFSDLQHFNRPGAQEFSKWLAPEIAGFLK